MRIAQRTITRNYKRGLNNTLVKQAQSLERATSGIAFKRLSQNVSDGVRAMHVQEQRVKSEKNLETVESLLLEFKSVDSNLDSMEAVLQTAQERLTKALNDSYGSESREILAKEIASIKDNIMQFANAQFAGKFMYSGTNNYEAPFGVDTDGKATFNGIKLEDIYKRDGKYYYKDSASVEQLVPHSSDIYMDIGLGIKMQNGEADPRTAFKVSVSGLELIGFGEAVDGAVHPEAKIANNLFDLFDQIEKAVYNSDAANTSSEVGMDNGLNQLISLTDKMRLSRSELGSRMGYLNSTKTQLDSDILNLTETESRLVTADPAEEAINMKNYEYSWLATLQLGSSILPTSLLDFLR